MKKLLVFLLAAVLLCTLAACTDKTEQPTDTTTTTTSATTSTTETKQPPASPIDYTVFCGKYSDTETVEGPCYTVNITDVDNATKAIDFSISYVGVNSSPLYTTESIHDSIASDHTVQFDWKDSWKNEGVGTLVLNPDDPSSVQLLMTVTKEAAVNRSSLSTNEQYKTFTRHSW